MSAKHEQSLTKESLDMEHEDGVTAVGDKFPCSAQVTCRMGGFGDCGIRAAMEICSGRGRRSEGKRWERLRRSGMKNDYVFGGVRRNDLLSERKKFVIWTEKTRIWDMF